MPFAAPRSYNVQNPLHFNYPKAPFLRGSQYSTYPKFKQTTKSTNLKPENPKDVNLELTKVLEKEIAELHTLTEQAKKIAESKSKAALQKNNLPNVSNQKMNAIVFYLLI
jgi:hypothetical protein